MNSTEAPRSSWGELTCGGTVGEESVTCGETFHFVMGSRYVVFAEGQPLVTDTCSGPFPVSPELIKQLGRSRKPSASAVRTMSTDAHGESDTRVT